MGSLALRVFFIICLGCGGDDRHIQCFAFRLILPCFIFCEFKWSCSIARGPWPLSPTCRKSCIQRLVKGHFSGGLFFFFFFDPRNRKSLYLTFILVRSPHLAVLRGYFQLRGRGATSILHWGSGVLDIKLKACAPALWAISHSWL